jgi:biotin carboxyl carrier protein
VPEVLALRYRDGGEDRHALIARAGGRASATYWLCTDAEGETFVAPQTVATDPRFELVDDLRFESGYHWRVDHEREGRLELDGIRREVSVRVERDPSSVIGRRVEIWVEGEPDVLGVNVVDADGATYFEVVEPWAASAHDGGGAGPTTPVPGTVTHVAVAVGDEVEAGAALVVLEAMKMEHTIRADAAGTVTEIHVSVGQSVDAHTVVATVEATS